MVKGSDAHSGRAAKTKAQLIEELALLEAKLTEGEEKYRAFFDNAHVGLARVRLSDGKILEVNERCAQMFGYETRERFMAEFITAERYVNPEDRDRIMAAGLSSGVIDGAEAQLTRRDGSPIWLRWSATFDPERDCTDNVLVDITEHKQAEQALRDSESKYRDLVEGSIQGIVVHNDDVITFANQAAADIFGYSGPEDLLALGSYPELTAPEERDRLRRFKEARLKGQSVPATYEFKGRRKDGSSVWLENRVTLIDWQGDLAIQTVVVDINERRLAEEALRESEAKFRSLVVGSIQGVCIQRDWHILFVNQALADILAYESPEDIVALGTLDALMRANQKEGLSAYTDARMHGEPAPDRYRMEALRRDGSTVWIEVIVNAVQWDGKSAIQTTVVDVTTEVEAVTEAATAREQLVNSLDAFPQAVVLYDKDDRLVFENAIYRNDYSKRYDRTPHGLKFEKILRDSARMGRVPEAEGRLEEWIRERMEQHRSKQSPVRQYRIDGEEETWLDVYDVATPDGGSLVMYLDVTVSQHQEERLRQSQKMEAVGQLTGGVAHDFNNLLAVVMGNAELLARWAVDASEKHRRAIDAIVRASQRGAELTQRLLAFSRKQMLDPEIIDLGTRLPDINAMLRRTLGETIDLKNVLAGNLWRCLVDPGQLENAILNLAINARDAMPRGGRLTIETSNTVLDRDYVAAHSDLEPGEYVMVAVSDSGVGMSADTVEHAFDPFFTTKEIGKGTGLGLSMVFGFAKQSGGHVTIYSEPDVGTTVKLYLPRSIEASEEQKEEPSTLPPPTREEIVLVVEDDADVRALTVTLVGSLGYEVLETANGPAALELLEQQPTVDILLTDVVLPHGLSGPEIAQRARKIVPGLKVLFMSGYAESAITHRGELEEGLVFLQKPFGLDDLANKLRTVLDGES